MIGSRRIINYLANSAKEKLSEPVIQRLRDFKEKATVWRQPEMPISIKEIELITARRAQMEEPRINLLITTINPEEAYGGVSTALKFFKQISQSYKNVRLIPTFREPSLKGVGTFSEYSLVSLEDETNQPKQIVSIAAPGGRTLAVGSEDIFVTTFWSTAYLAQRLVLWQSQEFNQPVKPIVYFIQDYEPGFYDWSSQYLLARSTYEYNGPMIAVFNSELLRQYFHRQDYRFDYEYSFEPKMNQVLHNLRPNLDQLKKHKQILVYGRPWVARNAFGLIVAGLRIWRCQFPQASTWEILSAGDLHRDVDLGGGVVMKSLGKLSLENYACTLMESAVGLSLMVSPHPSYPPLEMAHYGMWVLTNNYDNKDISLWHDNIISLKDFTPESIAHNLSILCQRVEADPTSGLHGKSHLQHYLSDDPSFLFLEEICGLLHKTSNKRRL
jgi:hypothetical protein